MISGAVARRYSQALFELAEEGNHLEQFEGELKLLAETMEQNPDIAKVLDNPQISPTAKKQLIEDIFKGRFSTYIKNFVDMLIDRRRQDFIVEIYNEFKHLADAARNIVEAQVKSAVPLDQTQHNRLQNNLSKLTGKTVRLVAEVDPSLIGGAVVKLGDRVIDGSVAGRLAKLKGTLVQ